jgi:hypothetical protein
MNYGKTTSAKKKSGVKINTARKRLPYSEKDCSKKSHNTAAQVTAELNIHLGGPASLKHCLKSVSQIQYPQ